MPLTLLPAVVAMLATLLATPSLAFERGAKKEAITLVQKALTHVETVGIQRALEDFKQPNDNPFRDRDFYVFVYDYQGNNLANSAPLNLPGSNLKDYRTTDGKLVIQEIIEMNKANGGGAFGYEMVNPETNETQAKIFYFKKIPNFDGLIGSGYYKPKAQ